MGPRDPADPHALDRYERLLGSAPPAVVERVHTEAFERLSPEPRDAILERLAAASPDERPADGDDESTYGGGGGIGGFDF